MRLNDISHHDYHEAKLRRMSTHSQKYDNDRLYIRAEPVKEDYDRLYTLSDSTIPPMNFQYYTYEKFGIYDVFNYVDRSYPFRTFDVHGVVKNIYYRFGFLATISKINEYMKMIFNVKTTLRSLSKECDHYTWQTSFSRRN